MKYNVRFPKKGIEKKISKNLLKIKKIKIQDKIISEVEKLSNNPRPHDKKLFKKIKPPVQFYQMTAQYRIRISDYRVLYDIDDKIKIVWILALRKRSEKTYRG